MHCRALAFWLVLKANKDWRPSNLIRKLGFATFLFLKMSSCKEALVTFSPQTLALPTVSIEMDLTLFLQLGRDIFKSGPAVFKQHSS